MLKLYQIHMSSKVCFIVKVIDFSYSQKIFMFMEDEETKIEINKGQKWVERPQVALQFLFCTFSLSLDALSPGFIHHASILGLPLWLRIHPQRGRPGFNPWVGKVPWWRERLPTSVFWPRKFHGLHSMGLQRVGHDWATFTFTLSSIDFIAV